MLSTILTLAAIVTAIGIFAAGYNTGRNDRIESILRMGERCDKLIVENFRLKEALKELEN